MIGDEDGYDDDDDGDEMMIILPSPLLGKLGTLYVNDMHDFYLNGRRVAISCFDLSCWYPVIFTLCFTYSVHCPYWPPFLGGLRFMPAGVDTQFGDPPA